ncbi:unnamed protein product [Prorocentrum cordatum]|uniref:Uncharacterized protein n=1 Tax=Prorocentrum cordatum TaxID=2364126 RepID=A0ABN9U0J5_9DINO|nr:unnamed protein product [Polarella glacialis]
MFHAIFATTAQAASPATLESSGRGPPIEHRAGPSSENSGRDELRDAMSAANPPVDSPPRKDKNDPMIKTLTKMPESPHFMRLPESARDCRLPADLLVIRVVHVQEAGVAGEGGLGRVERRVEVEDEATRHPRAPATDSRGVVPLR